jgi:dTDP-4-amino-4,6-dideoxygalactose transaminase
MTIPMTDLVGQYDALRHEIDAAVESVIHAGHFVLGPNVEEFEREVARYCGVQHAVAVASGTDALHLALRSAGIRAEDEVITTTFTFIGTAEAISHAGARPVFVDIESDTLNIDVKHVERAISPKTRAVIAVHLFGRPANLAALTSMCRDRDLILVEDCAQSFGAMYGGKKTGSHGDLGCFSFYPSKNLGAYGDGGMIVTDNNEFAETVRALRNHGSEQPYRHAMLGYNSRLDELQAAVLRVKLQYIDSFNAARREIATAYTQRLQHADIITPPGDHDGASCVYQQYTIRSDKRDLIRRVLHEAGIASALHYPAPLHRQEAYLENYGHLSLPISEQAAETVLSLPMYPELSKQQIDRICEVVLSSL